MLRRLGVRVLVSLPLILGITFLSFLLMHSAQGDYLSSMQLNPQIEPATIEAMRAKFGLDRPWPVQYFKWVSQMARGDLGFSFAYQRPVSEMIKEYVANTLLLSMTALLLALLIAFPLGVLSAVKRDSWLDRTVSLVATAGLAIPTLLLTLLALLFASRTGWFPVGGRESLSASEWSWSERGLDTLWHLVLPAAVLAVNPAILYLRQLRSNLASVLEDEYVLAARAKGLPGRRVIFNHALRNALNPMISLFGFSVAGLLNGAFLVEIIMAWPGLGRLTYDALLRRDLYVVMASLTLASAMLISGNLIADFLLVWNDPRIKS